MWKTLPLLLATSASPVFAVTTNIVAPSPIPEPGALALFGIGAVAAVVILAKKRNKKK